MSTLHKLWHVGQALAALGTLPPAMIAKPFGLADLQNLTEFPRDSTAGAALQHLQTLHFVVTGPGGMPGKPAYLLTPEGIEAAKAARQEALRVAAVNRANTLSACKLATSPYACRVWSLLRARQAITSLDAATLLTDAGGNVELARDRAAAYLRAWAASFPDAVQVSAKRFGKAKRYVLLKDLGPNPPRVTMRTSALPAPGATA